MNTVEFLRTAWDWNVPLILSCLVIVIAYTVTVRWRLTKRAWFLVAALAMLTIALASPVAALADGYLFSAHMVQHLLLLLVIPSLMLLSLPAARVARSAAAQAKERLAAMDKSETPSFLADFRLPPIVGWAAGVGAMWLWHVPVLCNAATSSVNVHALQVGSLLAMGAIFWWPVLSPRRRDRIAPLSGIVYLFSACVACTALGIYITFAPISVCSIYMHPVDRLGILPLIRNQWGIDHRMDQQVGGLLMWVPACLIYLSGVLGLLARWYRTEAVDATTREVEAISEEI